MGMIVGENSRDCDMDVNIIKGKALTNMRASGSDEFYCLVPPKIMSLESMLCYLAGDECIEVTPIGLRMRKKILNVIARRASAISQKAGINFKILE